MKRFGSFMVASLPFPVEVFLTYGSASYMQKCYLPIQRCFFSMEIPFTFGRTCPSPMEVATRAWFTALWATTRKSFLPIRNYLLSVKIPLDYRRTCLSPMEVATRAWFTALWATTRIDFEGEASISSQHSLARAQSSLTG